MKKVFYIAGSFVAALMLVTGCAEQTADDNAGSESNEINNFTNDKDTDMKSDRNGEFSEEEIRMVMEETFGDSMKIKIQSNRKYVLLTPTDPQFVKEVQAIVDGTMARDDWDKLVNSFRDMSAQVGEPYVIHLTNPDNESRKLLSVANGKVRYNFLNSGDYY